MPNTARQALAVINAEVGKLRDRKRELAARRAELEAQRAELRRQRIAATVDGKSFAGDVTLASLSDEIEVLDDAIADLSRRADGFAESVAAAAKAARIEQVTEKLTGLADEHTALAGELQALFEKAIPGLRRLDEIAAEAQVATRGIAELPEHNPVNIRMRMSERLGRVFQRSGFLQYADIKFTPQRLRDEDWAREEGADLRRAIDGVARIMERPD